MASTTSRGNYYKKRTETYFQKLGFDVQLTEFTGYRPIGFKQFVPFKKDVFGSDGISMSKKDGIIFWNAKHVTNLETSTMSSVISQGKKEYRRFDFPDTVKRWLVIWTPRAKEPIIVDCTTE